jgi:transposase-like protein/predicted DNA-binding transcriptional regulator
MVLIGLQELQGFYFRLNEDFKHMIFAEIRKKLRTWVKVAKRLGITDSTLHSIRNLKNRRIVWIKAEHLLRLSEVTEIPLKDIERNVLAIRKQTGHICTVKVPITCSPSLAGLIGHSLGDGHIGRFPTLFVYTSKNLSAICHVKDKVRETFGISTFYWRQKGNRYDVYFPRIVGELLLKFGSVSGAKTECTFVTPAWIMNGERKIKRAFLRAIFEDEGSVCIHPTHKGVILDMWKKKSLSHSLKSFLNQLRYLLMEFGVASRVGLTGTYMDKHGTEKIGFRIFICGKRNVARFKEGINFLSATKKKKLEILLKSYKKECWGIGRLDRAVHQVLLNGALTSEEISGKLEMRRATVRCAIKRLVKKGLVKRRGKKGRFLMWTANQPPPPKFLEFSQGTQRQ